MIVKAFLQLDEVSDEEDLPELDATDEETN